MQLISFSPFQCIFGDVFIWFEWIFLLWFLNKKNFFLTTLCSMWDLCSPTRDQTLTPCTGSTVLTTGLPEESLLWFFKWLKNSITIEFHMQNTVFTAKIWVSTQNNEKIEFIALCFDFDSILLFIEFFLPGPFKLLIQVIFDLIVSNFINKFAFISKYFSASFVLGIVQGLRNMKMMEQSTSPSEPWTLFLSQSDCIPLHPFFPPFFCPSLGSFIALTGSYQSQKFESPFWDKGFQFLKRENSVHIWSQTGSRVGLLLPFLFLEPLVLFPFSLLLANRSGMSGGWLKADLSPHGSTPAGIMRQAQRAVDSQLLSGQRSSRPQC